MRLNSHFTYCVTTADLSTFKFDFMSWNLRAFLCGVISVPVLLNEHLHVRNLQGFWVNSDLLFLSRCLMCLFYKVSSGLIKKYQKHSCRSAAGCRMDDENRLPCGKSAI